MDFGPLNFDIDKLTLKELHELNSAIHKLHDFLSAWTYHKKYEAVKDIELAAAYHHYAERIRTLLPDEWNRP